MPETFESFANQTPQLQSLWGVIREMAAVTREALGDDRLAWLRNLPLVQIHAPIALVHASPEDPWHASTPNSNEDELRSLYEPLGQQVVVYGHIHIAYIRKLSRMTVANAGSVGLPYDGDHRASYLMIDKSEPLIRRVEYDLSRELSALASSGFPHADWIARTLKSGSPQMP